MNNTISETEVTAEIIPSLLSVDVEFTAEIYHKSDYPDADEVSY